MVMIKANNINGCLDIRMKLDFIAFRAFKFPNTISGIVKKVKKEMDREMIKPKKFSLKSSNNVDIPPPINEISKVERKI